MCNSRSSAMLKHGCCFLIWRIRRTKYTVMLALFPCCSVLQSNMLETFLAFIKHLPWRFFYMFIYIHVCISLFLRHRPGCGLWHCIPWSPCCDCNSFFHISVCLIEVFMYIKFALCGNILGVSLQHFLKYFRTCWMSDEMRIIFLY